MDEELIKKEMKSKLQFQLLISALLIVVGCGLLVAGFCVPPVGEIHSSILIAFGEILTFVGAIFGIDYSYKYKIHGHGKDIYNETYFQRFGKQRLCRKSKTYLTEVR